MLKKNLHNHFNFDTTDVGALNLCKEIIILDLLRDFRPEWWIHQLKIQYISLKYDWQAASPPFPALHVKYMIKHRFLFPVFHTQVGCETNKLLMFFFLPTAHVLCIAAC